MCVPGHENVGVSAIEIVRYADAASVAWKNGAGVTRELASAARDHPAGGFDWRISVADVDSSGDFSTFSGTGKTT